MEFFNQYSCTYASRTSTPILRSDVLVAAFSNGRVALIDPERGVAAIDERIATAKGRSDLERLVDIDGKMVFQSGRLYAVSYQGKLVGIDLSAGRPLWSQDASSVVGLGSGFGNVYLAEAMMHCRHSIWIVGACNGKQKPCSIETSRYLPPSVALLLWAISKDMCTSLPSQMVDSLLGAKWTPKEFTRPSSPKAQGYS